MVIFVLKARRNATRDSLAQKIPTHVATKIVNYVPLPDAQTKTLHVVSAVISCQLALNVVKKITLLVKKAPLAQVCSVA